MNPRFLKPTPPLDPKRLSEAHRHLDRLTKPPGSLGQLESWIAQYAAIKGPESCSLRKKTIFLFAADHGVAEEGVSAYPQEVTAQMALNFLDGGSAINALARHTQSDLIVVDMGVAHPLPRHPSLLDRKIANGTANMTKQPAMSREQAEQALKTGYDFAIEWAQKGTDIFVAGEMGIANTTSGAAVLAVLGGRSAQEVAGRGTGIDDATLEKKIDAIERALKQHRPDPRDPLGVLATVGGFEIGAMAGLYLGAASRGVPTLVGGMISGAGAALALAFEPEVKDYLFPAHRSAEPASRILLDQLSLKPLLDLELRLGEGTGAALALNLLEAGVKLYNEMATFDQAGVSDKPSTDP